jgi:hypothetical protein
MRQGLVCGFYRIRSDKFEESVKQQHKAERSPNNSEGYQQDFQAITSM